MFVTFNKVSNNDHEDKHNNNDNVMDNEDRFSTFLINFRAFIELNKCNDMV